MEINKIIRVTSPNKTNKRRSVRAYIPISINIFTPGDSIVVKKNDNGFLIRKSTLDDKLTDKFHKGRFILLTKYHDYYNIVGNYVYEIIDNETIELIKI